MTPKKIRFNNETYVRADLLKTALPDNEEDVDLDKVVDKGEDEEEGKWLKEKYYGAAGAGLLVKALDTGRYLLLLRSAEVFEPGQVAILSGRVQKGDQPRETAIREAKEEAGRGFSSLKVGKQPLHVWTAPDAKFKFYTFTGTVDKEFKPTLNWENDAHYWVGIKDALKGTVHGHKVHHNVLNVLKLLAKTEGKDKVKEESTGTDVPKEDQALTPDQFHKKHDFCPKGYHWDGRHCKETEEGKKMHHKQKLDKLDEG